jgi:hypothetical protein
MVSRVMLMLIDTREPWFLPDEPDPRPRRSFNFGSLRVLRRCVPLVVGLVLVVLSAAFPPAVAYGLILAACVFIGLGLGGFMRSTPGLKDYHQ